MTTLRYSVAWFLVVGCLFFSCLHLGCRNNGIGPPTPLPEYVSIDDAPSWSPQGDIVAYFHFNRDRDDTVYRTGLYVIDTSGQNRRLVIAGLAYNPDWSPNGQKIVFDSGEIFTINVNGDSLFQVTNVERAHFPSWSPDGVRIAFDSPYQDSRGANAIWIINADGTNLHDISEHGTGEWRNPYWSRDGAAILHVRFLSGVFGEEIFVMDTSGNNPTRLTFNEVNDRYPKWSYDGARIAWTSGRNINEIWVMNRDGSDQRKIADGEKASWSPDGGKLVLSKPLNDKIVLFIIDLNTGRQKQLTF